MTDKLNVDNTEIEIYHEINTIKEKLIDLLYWIFTIVMWFALAGSLYRTFDLGIRNVNYLQIILMCVFLTVFFIRKKLPYLTKTWFLLVMLYILGVSSIITFGLFSQGMYLLLLFPILSAVLVDKNWGVLTFTISIATLIVSASLFLFNVISLDKNIEGYARTFSAWFMAIIIYSIITGIILVFWQRILGFLIYKIEDTAINKSILARVNKLLSKEIESRKTADLLLRKQYEDTKKLNKEYEEINQQLKVANKNLENSNILLREARIKAQAADQLKSSFLSNMSHEIRTPMNAIVGFSNLIANEDISREDKNAYLGIIESSTNSLLNTISDIINLAKIESGQFAIYPRMIDLNSFIDELQEKYTREIFVKRGNKVKIQFETNFQPHFNIISDIESLRQISNKLIDNAIKFTEKGLITVTINIIDNSLFNLKIQDSGLGIPKNIKSEIFESFRQIELGNRRRYGGTGIGLSISKGLIELLNGNIEFSSSPGQGATFNVVIPVIIENRNLNIELKQLEKKCSNKTILIIGKGTWENREINRILQELNSNLIYVESGFQALDTLKEHPEINIIIMAMLLPDINGYELAKIFKKTAPLVPVLAHKPANEIINAAQSENGWDAFIELPVAKDQFLSTMGKFLN